MKTVIDAIEESGFLQGAGAYVLVDGQYGSTGKGLMASVLAEHFGHLVHVVTSNAGPNSGHTSYYGEEQVVLKQLPTFGVMATKFHGDLVSPFVYMNGGAIIEPDTLANEIEAHIDYRNKPVYLHPSAAIVNEAAVASEKALVGRIGSTGKGTGAALAAKVMRQDGAIARGGLTEASRRRPVLAEGLHVAPMDLSRVISKGGRVFVEVSQGFSLSINADRFYPRCTSRDCTVAQALSDAGIHPNDYEGCAMVVRTFPIRVAGDSGGCYPDQEELTWEQVGQKPELTTVTQKVRRIFSWSDRQFADALRVNRPSLVLFNFMNYLTGNHWKWVEERLDVAESILSYRPVALLGYGPNNDEVVAHQ